MQQQPHSSSRSRRQNDHDHNDDPLTTTFLPTTTTIPTTNSRTAGLGHIVVLEQDMENGGYRDNNKNDENDLSPNYPWHPKPYRDSVDHPYEEE